mmetsp:Transcript_22277/g.72217  ORF Transcript_22277/g.72217 Transcript_22277/m.72217 type:complete len:264 (+) Transcript_22277:2492-3283(+)
MSWSIMVVTAETPSERTSLLTVALGTRNPTPINGQCGLSVRGIWEGDVAKNCLRRCNSFSTISEVPTKSTSPYLKAVSAEKTIPVDVSCLHTRSSRRIFAATLEIIGREPRRISVNPKVAVSFASTNVAVDGKIMPLSRVAPLLTTQDAAGLSIMSLLRLRSCDTPRPPARSLLLSSAPWQNESGDEPRKTIELRVEPTQACQAARSIFDRFSGTKSSMESRPRNSPLWRTRFSTDASVRGSLSSSDTGAPLWWLAPATMHSL